MDTEIRKRLEEAARKCVSSDKMLTHEEGTGALIGFMWGAEHGYKEAIAQAKEWLAVKGVFSGETCGDLKQYLADFEEAMNKLWEEKK